MNEEMLACIWPSQADQIAKDIETKEWQHHHQWKHNLCSSLFTLFTYPPLLWSQGRTRLCEQRRVVVIRGQGGGEQSEGTGESLVLAAQCSLSVSAASMSL